MTFVVHKLKCDVAVYGDVANGEKTFEFRKDDRGYAVGDILELQAWCPVTKSYLPESCDRQVTFILRGPEYGVPEGYVVMSISPSIRRIGEYKNG